MPRRPTRLLALALTLIALVFLGPGLATAQPQGKAALSAERPAASLNFLSRLRNLLSVLWTDTGSILEPDGARSQPNTAPQPALAGDTGSILDPDGRH
jgi:hypothetical protein